MVSSAPESTTTPDHPLSFDRAADGALVVRLAGAWQLSSTLPPVSTVERQLSDSAPRRIVFDSTRLGAWDSGLLTFLMDLDAVCARRGTQMDRSGLPTGVQRLLALAAAVPERTGARQATVAPSWLARIGLAFTGARQPILDMLGFIGDATAAFGSLLRGRARFRRSDLLLLIQQAGADALGIVTLISFLVGTILAFVGAVQLQQFGAAIYVADLVGIAMVREMGAMMTAIVIAGRTGAAYAAQLGTMKVTQEIDALTTMGISPLEFLVLPRMLALCLMMPLLCLYADFVGILGGACGRRRRCSISRRSSTTTRRPRPCTWGSRRRRLQGFRVRRADCALRVPRAACSAATAPRRSADAATSAVVTGIVFIISACGVFAVMFYVLGI